MRRIAFVRAALMEGLKMRILLAAATALAVTGSALAYQTYTPHQTHSTTTTTSATTPGLTVTVDPNVVLVAPASFNAEQRAMWDEWMDYHPGWTADQRAAFEAMMAIPPADWTAEQRMLYSEHLAHMPSTWTAEQRAAFESQLAALQTPWISATQTAEVDTVTTTTTTAMAPASPAVIQPSNANPEEDARGIPVISDVAYVPPGYNGIPASAMGGPVEGDDETYPPCTAERTDNCTQTYEVGSDPD